MSSDDRAGFIALIFGIAVGVIACLGISNVSNQIGDQEFGKKAMEYLDEEDAKFSSIKSVKLYTQTGVRYVVGIDSEYSEFTLVKKESEK